MYDEIITKAANYIMPDLTYRTIDEICYIMLYVVLEEFLTITR